MRNQDEVALFLQTWNRIVRLLRLMRALNVQGAFFAMHGRQVNDMAERMIRGGISGGGSRSMTYTGKLKVGLFTRCVGFLCFCGR